MRKYPHFDFHGRRLSSLCCLCISSLYQHIHTIFPLHKSFRTFNQGIDTPVSPAIVLVDVGVEYMRLEGGEKLERYRKGGYYPTTIGDHLHDRYRIGRLWHLLNNLVGNRSYSWQVCRHQDCDSCI
ncbi:hypothetical protein V1509DRAFT_451114 [Lipomyces kononenkoae]